MGGHAVIRGARLFGPYLPWGPASHAAIDEDIAHLVHAMNNGWIITQGSCCGHGNRPAYIDFSVRGLRGIRRLHDFLNLVDRFADLDCRLNWSEEVATAYDPACAQWVAFSMDITSKGGSPPSRRLLNRIAGILEQV